MKSKKAVYFLLIIIIHFLTFSPGCKTAKNDSSESGKKLPGDVAIAPSTFRCQGIVVASNSQTVSIQITKMLEQGSSLFYSVNNGDTVEARFQSPNKTDYSAMKNVEAVIEERVTLNSAIPEFIVRQIK